MVQPPSNVHELPADRGLGMTPQLPAHESTRRPAKSPSRPAGGTQVRARARTIREVAVVEVAGRLSDVLEDVDRAIQVALAGGPRGVVCDLSGVLGDADPVALEVLATAGRHVRDWPGVPVAVASADHRITEALRSHPLGGHLMLAASLFSAVSEVLATPALTIQRRQLSPHPTAPRAARDFVTRTLLGWGLGRVIPLASLVAGELVASSSVYTGTDIDISVAWNLGALRLTVRDHGPALPRQPDCLLDPHWPRLGVVAFLTRAFGVLPTANGGKVVWAVLEAPKPRTSSRSTSNG